MSRVRPDSELLEQDVVLTIMEVAQLLKCSRQYVYMMIDDGRLRYINVGKKKMVPTEVISNLLHSAHYEGKHE
jgi:excisionase family DNA binding protein